MAAAVLIKSPQEVQALLGDPASQQEEERLFRSGQEPLAGSPPRFPLPHSSRALPTLMAPAVI